MVHARSYSLLLLFVSAGLFGCNAIFGIDDLSYDPVGGGAPAGAGALGGSAGVGGTPLGGAAGAAAHGGGGGSYPTGPFGGASPVSEISSASADDDDPTFTEDGLELYFNSTRGAGQDTDIWRSVRLTTSDPWGTPVEVGVLNTDDGDTNPTLSPDGLTLWLSSDRDTLSHAEIYVSTRADRGAAWSTPELVPELNSSGADMVCGVTSDALMMLLVSDRAGGTGNWDLYLATRASEQDGWGNITELSELNSATTESSAWLRADGLEVYLSSQRDDPEGDLYRALRPDLASPFGSLELVSELNTAERETDPWLSADGHYIMFSRGPALRNIYHAWR